MKCDDCGYEFTLKQIQAEAECPVCADATMRHVGAAGDYVRPQQVVVVDFQMSFNSMVWFMVKAALASIPALIILAVIGALLTIFFGAFFGVLSKM
ncbi:FmdB family zinc ribbon protein [Metapseudomonas furukawaii]|uniref:hypothetical protein n=1 Tax=Metapseudomonas furukawaii TaxID=1149133 RepID=UPI0005617538|nr:hypothetical protein [Pseudomonas furukawaii]